MSDLSIEFSVHRVPFQKMGQGGGISEIVDAFDAFDILLRHGAEDVPPDPAEAIYSVVSHSEFLFDWSLVPSSAADGGSYN